MQWFSITLRLMPTSLTEPPSDCELRQNLFKQKHPTNIRWQGQIRMVKFHVVRIQIELLNTEKSPFPTPGAVLSCGRPESTILATVEASRSTPWIDTAMSIKPAVINGLLVAHSRWRIEKQVQRFSFPSSLEQLSLR